MFMRLMSEILRPFIRTFVVVYFDDILVFGFNETSYVKHLFLVFEVLRQQKLHVKLKKCDF